MKATVNKQVNRFYEFDSFRIDTRERLLLQNHEPIPLLPKAFDTLLVLLQNSGEVLDKDYLLKEIWPDSVVEENNLAQAISEIREALSEGAKDQRFIVTVRSRGYRFAAEVKECLDEEIEPVTKQRTQSAATKQRVQREGEEKQEERRDGADERPFLFAGDSESRSRWRQYRWIMLTSIAVALGIAATSYYINRRRAKPGLKVKSIAVLPFRPVDTNNPDEALQMGLSDALITRLANLREIIVRPAISIAKYNKPEQGFWELLAVGRELKVDALLAGHVQRSGNKIRVTAQLVSVADGAHLWSEKFDDIFTDIFAAEDSMSKRIAEALLPNLTGNEQKLLAKHYTESSEAYEKYLYGRFYWNRRTNYGLQKAITYFEEAIRIDPTFALAYSGLADCYSLLHEVSPGEGMQKAMHAAMEAVRLDGSLAEAHRSLAQIKIYYDWDWLNAETEVKRSIALNSHYADAYRIYAVFFMVMGRFQEALTEAKRASECDPVAVRNHKLPGMILYFAGQYDKAIEQYEKALEMEPGYPQAQREIGLAYEQKGMYQEALAALKKTLDLPGTTVADIAHVYAVSGNKSEAERILNELIQKSERTYVSPYDIAIVYAGLGKREKALEWLNRAYEDHSYFMSWLQIDPRLRELRLDPQFVTLVREVGLAQ
jgi:DNA-binding winged helix-turn-helix (wHTH) protein/TolB-like protein/Flp pilus assembly protein TadD